MRASLPELDEALLRLRRLWNASRQDLVTDNGRPVGLSSLLIVEACARNAEQGRETVIADIADWAVVAHSTASRLVDRAVSTGLVTRTQSTASRRRVAVELTRAGQRLRERAVHARTTWLAEQVSDWTDTDLAQLALLLGRFAQRLNPDPHPPASGPGPTAADG